MSVEILAALRSANPLSWWWDQDRGTTVSGFELVEKIDGVSYDSYGYAFGSYSMVFAYGGAFYKASLPGDSYGSMEWDPTEEAWGDHSETLDYVEFREVQQTIKLVTHWE